MSNVVEYWEDCLRLRIVAQILQLPADCVCSALTLLHRFRRSTTLTPRHLIAACLFSASKLEEVVSLPFLRPYVLDALSDG